MEWSTDIRALLDEITLRNGGVYLVEADYKTEIVQEKYVCVNHAQIRFYSVPESLPIDFRAEFFDCLPDADFEDGATLIKRWMYIDTGEGMEDGKK